MLRSKLARILLTCSFPALISACASEPKVFPLNLKAKEPTWFLCERVNPETDRPALPATPDIDWSQVVTIDQARLAHEEYVRAVKDRNGIVIAYVVKLEGVNFQCWNNMENQNQFYDKLPKSN